MNDVGQVAMVLKVMPESADTDIGRIKKEIKKIEAVRQVEEKPIAFGLKCLEVLLMFDDKKGSDDIEKKIEGIEGVASVETVDVTLV